ncbi:gene transfer agent family protein [Zavarzinia aquatilis]|uniref:Gene transfer agent family protein n=1 Tax=Zavarzinia aquatilis TaxID=2211142 RepID=A0A317EBN8_9PROT|nr:gene transfer agent family protein [Zavarzinia aquatilis]PWR22753.1 hypothetical protein DKG74_09965 [Zavarzinia aquatilis]
MSDFANPHRGEVSVTLGGQVYRLRPSFAALAETEVMAGCGLVPLARRFLDGSYGLRDVVAVLVPALKAAGQGGESVGQLVIDTGFLTVAPACAALLAAALAPDREVPNPL